MAEEAIQPAATPVDAPSQELPKDIPAPGVTEETAAPEEVDKTEETVPETVEPPADAGDDGEEEPASKKLPGSQRLKRRLNQVAADYAALVQHNQELERRLAAPTEGKPGVDRAPAESDYPNDYLAYDRARQQWDMRQVFREERNTALQREQATAMAAIQQERAEAYQESLGTVRERIPDFDKVVQSAKDLQVSPAVINELAASEKAALLQYHLAKNPDMVRDLNSMTGNELARAIGRLEGRVHLPKPVTQTKAAPPPTQVKGGGARSIDVNDPNISMEDYIALRKKQSESDRRPGRR